MATPAEEAFTKVVGSSPESSLPGYKSKSATPLSLISYAPQAFENTAIPTMKVNLGTAQPMAAAPEAEPLAPIAAPAAIPAAPVAEAAPVLPVKNPAEPAMITRSELSKRQYEQQQKTYMENWNNQVKFLQSTGAYRPDQLNFKPPTFGGYKNTWGSYSNDLVPNPYA
jgi:hypothetical protein